MRRSFIAVALAISAAAAGACKEEGTIKVHSLKFAGVKNVKVGQLENVLATQTSSKLPWGKKKYFDRSRFDADLKRIQAFYADRGYPDARVTSFDVKLNDKQDAVDITVAVAEGQPVVVAAVNFVGFDVIPPQHLGDLQKQIPLKNGQPRDRQLVVTTHEMAVNELKDHGYPSAKVDTKEDDGANGKSATLTFTAQPGELAYFGPVKIVGNKSVSDHVIEREVAYKPGDLYRRSLVQDTQRRLYGLELFQFVNVAPTAPEPPAAQQPAAADGQSPTDQQPPQPPAEPTDQNGTVPTTITVAEGKHHRVNFGAGYGTEEKVRVDAQYHDVNFLGGARTAGVHARWSALDKGIKLDFNQPYFFAPHFSIGGEGQRWYTYTPAYNSITTGAKATLTHRADPRMSWDVFLNSEHVSTSIAPEVIADPKLYTDLIALGLDPTTQQQNGTLTSIGFDFMRAMVNSLLDPRKGYQLAFHAEKAGGFLPGSFEYFAMSVDGRYYIPITDRFVFATRAQIGSIQAPNNNQDFVPFSRRYFLGGSTTIRGWGRFEISPLGTSGLPIGGNSLLLMSEEFRVGVTSNLGLVAFLDTGNVWADPWGFHLNDLRYAVGPGLRYQTPVGPIRFDFGYQLNPIPGLIVNGVPETRHWRLHFSIGQAF